MMRALAVAASLACLAGCHFPTASSPETASERHIPVLQLSEDQDEWLYGHCAYRGLGAGAAGAPMGQTPVPDANLGELLYEHDGVSQIAVFACRQSPPFIAGGVAPVEPAAPLPEAPPAPVGAPLAPLPAPEVQPSSAVRALRDEVARQRPLAPYGTAAVVLGVLGLAAGAVTGVVALDASNGVHAHCDANRVCDPQGLDSASKGPPLATASTACFLGGGALAAAGVVLLAIPGTPVEARPAANGLGLSFEGAF